MNNGRTKVSQEEFSRMDQQTKDFHVITTLNEVLSETRSTRDEMRQGYARKWVEYFAKAIVSMILVAFFSALIALVITSPEQFFK